MLLGSFLRRAERGRLLPQHADPDQTYGVMGVDLNDYASLLEGLSESREHLRVMQGGNEQQVVDLTKAFYRIDLAAAAIRHLLDQVGQR